MNYNEYKDILKHDLYRYDKGQGMAGFVKAFLKHVGFKVVFCMRTCDFIRSNKLRYLLLFPIFLFLYLRLKRYCTKYHLMLTLRSNIGKGFCINHYGSIGIHQDAKIGKNLTIFQGAYIAFQGRGGRIGVPTLGDGVFVGMGAKIFGNIKIGNNVAIGANTVVATDIPDNAIVIGNPGIIISYDGAGSLQYNILEQDRENEEDIVKKVKRVS